MYGKAHALTSPGVDGLLASSLGTSGPPSSAGEERSFAMGERMEDVAERTIAVHDESKWAPLTTEFWAMVVLVAAILIAAAISDSLNDIRAWTLVAGVGAAYILSRGIAKAGTDHSPRTTAGRRRRS